MEDLYRLKDSDARPVIDFDFLKFKDCRALVDTGAPIPVWTANEKILMALGARLKSMDVYFSGFGGDVGTNLYILPCVTMKGLTFIDFPVVVDNKKKAPYSIVLSAIMFQNLDLNFYFTNKTMLVRCDDSKCVRNRSSGVLNGRVSVNYNDSFNTF